MNYKRWSFTLIIMIIGITLGIVAMIIPKPKGANTSEFSAMRASAHIEELSKESHDAGQTTALREVEKYITDQITGYGYTVEVNNRDYHDADFGDIVLHNLLTTIPGQNDSYILLVAHYDSSHGHRIAERPGSHGAADDGYGVATMLEIANIIHNSNKPLVNGIKLLFTDGEEIGTVGARLEVEQNPSFFDNVGYVINIEARGVKGPAIMFETSADNNKVIDFYHHANLPISYSFAGDVYSKMPNSTDFTHFKNDGLNGINFAVLDSLYYYHTPRDNFSNISLKSVQHYGEQILPLVDEYIYHSQYSDIHYFDSNQNAIYFSFLPNVFIKYNVSTAYIWMVIAFILVGLSLYYLHKKEEIKLSQVFKWSGIFVGLMFGFLLVGVIVSYLISFITPYPFSLTYMPSVPFGFGFYLIFVLLETVGCLYIIYKYKDQDKNIYFASLVFNSLFLLIFMIVLPGGSYIFLWPILLSLITFFVTNELKDKLNEYVHHFILGLNIILSLIIFVPILYLIYLALTFGALGIIGLLAFFPLTIIASTNVFIQNHQEN